jgi:hypothetical protein
MATVRDLASALALAREQRVVPFTDVDGLLVSFVGAVTGEPVRGSWWGHRLGRLIFNLGGELEGSGEVLAAKLVAGKITFVHRSLWPALLRVVEDAGWRKARMAELSATARDLLEAVEREGELRLDRWAESRKLDTKGRRALARARGELEARLLVRFQEVHTEAGVHASFLETWARWPARDDVAPAAAKLSFDEALVALREACRGCAAPALDGGKRRDG